LAVNFEFSECGGMSFNWLADVTFPAEELHRAFDFEAAWGSIPHDTNKDEPFAVAGCTIIDDLGSSEGRMSVEDLLRWACSIFDSPMEDSRLANEAEGAIVNPLPKYDVFVDNVRLDLLLRVNVKHLKLARG
jgi:hypothetical protein